MPVAFALAPIVADAPAVVLQALVLACGLIVDPWDVHVFAMVRHEERGRDAKILALLLSIAVMAAANVDEATILVVDAVRSRCGCLERARALVRPLLRLREDQAVGVPERMSADLLDHARCLKLLFEPMAATAQVYTVGQRVRVYTRDLVVPVTYPLRVTAFKP